MFVRTMLAMSLSCIIAGTAFAASATEQPLNPKKVATDVTVQDPIDPLATEASEPNLQILLFQLRNKAILLRLLRPWMACRQLKIKMRISVLPQQQPLKARLLMPIKPLGR